MFSNCNQHVDRLVGMTLQHSRSPSRIFSPMLAAPQDKNNEAKDYGQLLQSALSGSKARLHPKSRHAARVLNLTGVADLPSRNLLSTFRATRQEEILRTYESSTASSRSNISEPVGIQPSKILEAPNLEDDFYLNLLDWSTHTNCIAIGLGRELYSWNEKDGKTTLIATLPQPDIVAAVTWRPQTAQLAIGTKCGKLELVDVGTQTVIRKFKAHCGSRTGVIAWNERNNDLFSSGGRDKQIIHHDIRCKYPIAKSSTHSQEICGLKWDQTGTRLASGGNDNKLFVWDPRNPETPIYLYDKHVAAVKAIAWSPHVAGLLASGGGTADRTMRFWNTRTSSTDPIKSINVASQVCNMAWSPHTNEIVTSHGFSEHQILRWSYPSLVNTAIMSGHQHRVLHLCLSPDGKTVVTGSADQTLRFWPAFSDKATVKHSRFRNHGIVTNPFYEELSLYAK